MNSLLCARLCVCGYTVGGYSGDVQATMAELWLLDFDTTEWQPILPSDGSADHSDSTDGGTDLACHPPARSGHAAAMVYDNIMVRKDLHKHRCRLVCVCVCV